MSETLLGDTATAGKTARDAVVQRIVLAMVGCYLFLAAGNRLAERLGMRRCDCAKDCWCYRPGRGLFRWAFPWGHRATHTAEKKAGLDLTGAPCPTQLG